MYCKNCGKEIDDNAYVCPHCGVKVEKQTTGDDSGSKVGWGILSFLIPLVGLILFCMWKNDKPATAKVCGSCALVSFILGIVSSVIYSVLVGVALAGVI